MFKSLYELSKTGEIAKMKKILEDSLIDTSLIGDPIKEADLQTLERIHGLEIPHRSQTSKLGIKKTLGKRCSVKSTHGSNLELKELRNK